MRVSLILPDCLDEPIGGLGEQCRQMLRFAQVFSI